MNKQPDNETPAPEKTLADIFAAIPGRFNQRKAPVSFKATYVFYVGFAPNSPAYTLAFDKGKLVVTPGAPAEGAPDLTVSMAEEDMRAMALGKLTGQKAFSEGKMRLEGDVSKAAALPLLFD